MFENVLLLAELLGPGWGALFSDGFIFRLNNFNPDGSLSWLFFVGLILFNNSLTSALNSLSSESFMAAEIVDLTLALIVFFLLVADGGPLGGGPLGGGPLGGGPLGGGPLGGAPRGGNGGIAGCLGALNALGGAQLSSLLILLFGDTFDPRLLFSGSTKRVEDGGGGGGLEDMGGGDDVGGG
jgi:hypothetical protein